LDIYIRKRGSGPSIVAVAAFLFGLLIGFSACYAIFVPQGEQSGPPTVASLPSDQTPEGESPEPGPSAPPVDTPPEPETPAVAETPPDPGTELEMLEDTWVARHLFLAINGTKLDDATRDLLAELKPGGIVLTGENITSKIQTIGLTKSIKDAVGLGKDIDSLPLIAVAQEGGEAGNPLRLTDAPSLASIGERRDLELARAVGLNYAESSVGRGIGVLFAPILDVYAADTPEAVRARSLGADYQAVRSLGLAFAQGVTQGGVIPVVKHFPGIGAATGDGRETIAVLPNEIPLEEVVFPFNEAVTRGIPGILVGHVAVPAFDTDAPNRPASLSPKMLTDLVRKTWKYSGVIVADDLTAPAIAQALSPGEAAVQAFAAGCDAAILLDPDFKTIRDVVSAVDEAVNAGVLSRTALSDSKERLDRWQQWLRKPVPGITGEIPPLPPLQVAGETPTPALTAPLSPASTYTVVSGDTLYKVAQTYNVTIQQLQEWNNLRNTTLRVGQVLAVGPATAEPESEPAATPEALPAEPVEAQAEPEAPAEPDAQAPAEESSEPPESAMPPEEVPEETPEIVEAVATTVTHTVKAGEYLATIANTYGVAYQDIMRWNNLSSTNIYAGQKLTIHQGGEPAPEAAAPEAAERTYTVQRGDFLGKIAEQHGVTVRQLMDWNNLSSIDLEVGQVLVIK
jgi:beta-N-acetylhexosaminidase